MISFARLARHAFYNVESRWFLPVNNFLAIVTIAATLAIILETVPELISYKPLFLTIEWLGVLFFTIEYIARIAANRKDVKSYVFSFFGVVDLLSIFPSYIGLANLTYLKTARVLRILRLLKMVRIAKLVRFEEELHTKDPDDFAHIHRLNVMIYFFALLSAMIIFGSIIYVVEEGNPDFGSIPLGILWASKVILGGVAYNATETVWGDIVSVGARFAGLALFGLLISVIGSWMRKMLFGEIR